MTEAARFLERLGELLTTPPERAGTRADLLEAARQDLAALRLAEPSADFLIEPAAVRWGARPVELADDAWLARLRAAGISVLAPPTGEGAFERWVTRLAGQLAEAAPRAREAPEETRPPDGEPSEPEGGASEPPDEALEPGNPEASADARPADAGPAPAAPAPGRAATVSLQDAADGAWDIHESAARGGFVREAEAWAVVEALRPHIEATDLRARGQPIGELDETTTVHALNVALLSMRLARHLAYGQDDILAVGFAALLHDIGKVRLGDLPSVSRERLSPDERRLLESHTTEGARLLLDSGEAFALAALVAYEHHTPWKGEAGYPRRHYPRPTHPISRITRVCDVYDVLSTERSFRPALGRVAAAQYLEILGGTSLDPEIATAFGELVKGPLPRIETPRTREPAQPHEIGWLPEAGYDPDCEPRPIRL